MGSVCVEPSCCCEAGGDEDAVEEEAGGRGEKERPRGMSVILPECTLALRSTEKSRWGRGGGYYISPIVHEPQSAREEVGRSGMQAEK